MPYISKTPKPPYYAVIFTSINAPVDHTEHAALSARLVEHAQSFAGYLGIEGSRNTDGTGVTAVYWKDLDSIQAWAKDPMHMAAKAKGPRGLVFALHDPHLQGGAGVRQA